MPARARKIRALVGFFDSRKVNHETIRTRYFENRSQHPATTSRPGSRNAETRGGNYPGSDSQRDRIYQAGAGNECPAAANALTKNALWAQGISQDKRGTNQLWPL
jgi:hypothetical protein